MNAPARWIPSALCAAVLLACGDSHGEIGTFTPSDGALPVQDDAGAPAHDASISPDAQGLDDAGGTCAMLDARPRPKASAVWFIVNPVLLNGLLASSDNTTEITNRQMLRDLLFGDAGLLPTLGDNIQFGLGCHVVPNLGSLGGACPTGRLVPAARDNGAALVQVFDALPSESGATWASMAAIADDITRRSEPTQHTVILVNSHWSDAACDPFTFGSDLQRMAVQRLAQAGARVSVMTLLYVPGQASDAERANDEARTMGKQLAALGNGQEFASYEAEAVRQFVMQTVAEAVSCEVRLEGKVEAGKECLGTVRLGGEPLVCNGADGFRLRDERTLTLTGSACALLRANAAAPLTATFPCDAFVVLY